MSLAETIAEYFKQGAVDDAFKLLFDNPPATIALLVIDITNNLTKEQIDKFVITLQEQEEVDTCSS